MTTQTRVPVSAARGLVVAPEWSVLPDLHVGVTEPPGVPGKVADEIIQLLRLHGYFIIRWQGSWLVYRTKEVGGNGRYQRVNEADDRKLLVNMLHLSLRDARYIQRGENGDEEDGEAEETVKHWNPTGQRVHEVAEAIEARVNVSATFSGQRWLDEHVEVIYPGQHLIACRNGLVNTSFVVTGVGEPVQHELLPHSDRFVTEISLDLNYDPLATCARWLKFLDELWPGDPDTIACVQEIMGLLVSGFRGEVHKMFMFIGPPRSGKGTIAHVIEALQGGEDHVDHPTLQRMGQSFGLAPMLGKRVGIVGDARTAANTAAIETLLGISGGDVVSVNRKNKAELQVKLPILFVIMSNEPPNMHDPSGALANRFVPVAMTKSFLGKEDLGLLRDLRGELAGIFNWCLEGLRRLRASNFQFTMSQTSKDLLEKLVGSFSPITRFVQDRDVVAGTTLEIQRDDLYMSWARWCADQGEKTAGSKTEFTRSLTAIFPGIKEVRRGGKSKQIWWYTGVGRNPESLSH